jgi:hypothetical protein
MPAQRPFAVGSRSLSARVIFGGGDVVAAKGVSR